jgi:transcriptional regulator of aromatic amino acid metabolism
MAYFFSKEEEKNTDFSKDPDILSLFGFSLEEMQKIERNNQKTKFKMNSNVISILHSYKIDKNINCLKNTTFKYIVNYKTNSDVCKRLNIVLSNFGFTINEIDKMTIDDILDNIINR